jgi:hypothetical protein
MNEGLWIPVVLFIVTGLCTIAFFFYNHKYRNAIMESVQKSMDTWSGSRVTGSTGTSHVPARLLYELRYAI